jgi:hypothetical protein
LLELANRGQLHRRISMANLQTIQNSIEKRKSEISRESAEHVQKI